MAQVGAPPLKVIKPHFASTRLAFAEAACLSIHSTGRFSFHTVCFFFRSASPRGDLMFSSASNSWRSRRNSRREPSGRFSATSRPGSPSGDSNPPTFRRQSSSSPKVAPNPFSGEASHSLASYDDAAQPRGWAGALLARLRGDDAMGSFKRKESKGNLFHERQKARRSVIDPQNPGWVAWEWVVLVIALWNLAALPWYFAFAPDDAVRLLGVDTALDALFLLDMLCRTRLAFPDRRGRLVTEPRVLFANYARGRLVVDLLSFLPLSLLAAAAAPELPARTIAFLGLNRGLRVSRFIGNARLSRLTAQSAIWRMVHLLFLFVLFAHWLGSGFFALSFLHEPSSWGDASLATPLREGAAHVVRPRDECTRLPCARAELRRVRLARTGSKDGTTSTLRGNVATK